MRLEWAPLPMWGAFSERRTFTIWKKSDGYEASVNKPEGGALRILGLYASMDEAQAMCQRIVNYDQLAIEAMLHAEQEVKKRH